MSEIEYDYDAIGCSVCHDGHLEYVKEGLYHCDNCHSLIERE